MENNQVKKLKINVTTIKSSLFKNNKELIRLKKEKIKLFSTQESQSKISKKEKSVESESSFKQSVANIGKQLIAKPLSLIDKFKEFFGLILLGIFVNNLPKIIETLQNIFAKIKDFLDKNPLIMQGIKLGFKIIGVGIMGLVKLIKEIRPYIGGSFKFALDTLKSTKNQIGSLITTFDELNLSFGGLIKDLDVNKIPDPSKDAAKYSSFVAGGGKAALESKGMTVDEVVEQGKKNISGYDVKPERQTQTPAPQLSAPGSMYPAAPPQKLARGGTIRGRGLGNINPAEGTGRGGPSDVAKIAPYLLKGDSRTPFARPGGTAIGRKTIEKAGAFGQFQRNVENQRDDQKDQKQNYNLMEELLEKFKELQKLRGKEKPGSGGGGNGGSYQRPEDIPLIGGPGIEGLSDFIAGAETGGRSDAYSGDNGKGDPAMLSMTLTELSQNYRMAVGAHQFMPNTAIGLARQIGLDPSKVIFNRETQDRLNRYHLNSMGYADFVNGSLSDKDFGRRIAIQYRALPDPYTGETFADKYKKRNRATRTLDEFKQALANAKKSKNISLRVASGADPNLTSQFSPVSGTSGTVKYNGQLNAPVNIPYSPFKDKTGNPTITSTVGYRGSTKSNHRGLDISADPGTPLYAYLPGTVTKSGDYGDNYGNSFEWKDSEGNLHFFGHLQTPASLKVGEQVIQGRNVGKVGSTGRSTGPHLHWEIRRSSGGQQYTDPVSWVKSFSLPKPTAPVKPTGGQQIIPNFGIPVGKRIYFKLGGVEYHAYKTTVGFDFYKGNTKVTNPNEEKQVTEAFIKYMESKRKPATTTSVSALPPEVKVTPRTSEIASSATNAQNNNQGGTNTVLLTRTHYVVQPLA